MNSKTAIETATGQYLDVLNIDPEVLNLSEIAFVLSGEPRFGGHTISHKPYSVASHSSYVARLIYKTLSAAVCNAQSEDMKSLVSFMYNDDSISPVEAADRVFNLLDIIANCTDVQDPHLDSTISLVSLFGLLHDAQEAFLRDIPNPIKQVPGFGAEYKKLEDALQTAIYAKFIPEYTKLSAHDGPMKIINKIIAWADIYALQVEANVLVVSKGKGWNMPFKLSQNQLDAFELKIDTPREQIIDDMLKQYKNFSNRVLRMVKLT